MVKLLQRVSNIALALMMAFTVVFSNVPGMVFAVSATKQMAHLKSGSGNGNGHFGGATPEAFVLSDKADITNENFQYEVKIGSEKAATRFRFVTKYADDTHWGYIAYDGLNNNWFYEYKNGDKTSYPSLGSNLPALNKNDIVAFTGTYEADGLHLSVENKTTKMKETAIASDADFNALASLPGKIGFGAATFGKDYTDIYFHDVMIGDMQYVDGDYASWTIYKEADQVWEPSIDVATDDGSSDLPDIEEPSAGRAWINVTGGSHNGGGHNYGNPASSGPVTLLDNDKNMGDSGTLSMALKPSANWGAFYNYVDDNNWLYVGWDSSSKWYYQYKVDGEGEYPKIGGLPDPVAGEEMKLTISLSRETLSVEVNGTTVRTTNQKLINFADKTNGKGRFGIKTNGATSISIADVTYNGVNCMDDNWVFAAERAGQIVKKTYTKLVTLTGVVSEQTTGSPIAGATIRIGNNVAKTMEDGSYSFAALEAGTYAMAVTMPGYQAHSGSITLSDVEANIKNVALAPKEELNVDDYDIIASDTMRAYIGKDFPLVARYTLNNGTIVRANETPLDSVSINGVTIKPVVSVTRTTDHSRTYHLAIRNAEHQLDFGMDVEVLVEKNTLTWKVTDIRKAEGCASIATIDVPGLNLLSIDAVDKGANFAGAQTSTTTTASGDRFMDFDNGFVPSNSEGYLYAFLSNEKASAGLFSNSEVEGDKRVIRNNGADTISLTSAPWYYELGDKNGQKVAGTLPAYPTSELPCVKVSIAEDRNEDGTIDWNDGALAYRDIMNIPYGSEDIKDMVNYRIVMNFASMASNPYLVTADNIKKVNLATDGLPQAVMLKGYGNEGHDSANSEYADIAEREGGVADFQELIKIAHDNHAEIGIHVNAQEAYPEAASFHEEMLQNPISNGWGWLDQSFVINKHWDLATQARWKRFVQLYDRINGTSYYDRSWPEAVENSKGEVKADKTTIQEDAENRPDNMDFIYLDVWYQDSWETRQIAKEINALGWRFSTEFSAEGEYDSTWQHWSTDASYGGAGMKGYNSDIIRFIRNDQRDSQVLNYPAYGGTADNPLLGGYRLYGFEGWGGDKDFNNYIKETFNQNLPTKFLQHYYVSDWETYAEGESPVGNHEKQITLKNDAGDQVIVTRNETQRSDENIERTITLNGKTVLNDVTYLLPWMDEDGTEKLYHWNLDGGTTSWELPADWAGLGDVVCYELSDQGRMNEVRIPVKNGSVTLPAKAATAYVLSKGAQGSTMPEAFGEADYVVDPGFNGYAQDASLSDDHWTGDIHDAAITITKADTGDQRLTFTSPERDVMVSTSITGLHAGKNYVAEVYVENNSDVKATLTIDSGKKVVSNYTERSILKNYVKSDQKNGSNMQRMMIPFTAESDTATLSLARVAGIGTTYIDDIRIVEKTIDNIKADGSLTQDFESVVQGLYPFVLSSAQGISDPATHLSQRNDPYTQAGWNGRVIDDVIDGEWSLKHHDGNTGIIYQTLPQNYRFKAGSVYTVEFDYQSGPDKGYAMVVGDGETYSDPLDGAYLAQANGTTKHVTMHVIGSASGQTWIGLYQNGNKAGEGNMGQRDFTLDNLVIREDSEAIFADITNTSLYKGEVAQIVGSHLDKITWTSSDDTIAQVHTDLNEVHALRGGEATITGTLPDGSILTFPMKVADTVVEDIDRKEYAPLTTEANTEESAGEPNGNGVVVAAGDGDSDTYWHSQWSGGGFNVSQDTPAVIKAGLNTPLDVNGFKFQQRNSGGGNGMVAQFSYRILGEDGVSVLASGEHIRVADAQQKSGAWIMVPFEQKTRAVQGVKYLELSIEEGRGNFASIAEIQPIRMQRVADDATLSDITLREGATQKMEVQHPEHTMLKGIVWQSDDESIASVSQDGVVSAIKAGTTTIHIQNVAGLYAKAVVTVEKNALNLDALRNQITKAKALQLDVYPDSTLKNAFIKALAHAEDMLSNATTQEEVDRAVKNLADAQEELVKSVYPDVEAPTIPGNLKATPAENSVTLSWSESEDNVGVSGYAIYLGANKIGTVATTGAIIEHLSTATSYHVEVRAYDAAGNLSDPAQIQFTTKEAVNDPDVDPEEKPDPKPDGDQGSDAGTIQPTLKPVEQVDTGDDTSLYLLITCMVLAGGGAIITYRRKQNKKVQ